MKPKSALNPRYNKTLKLGEDGFEESVAVEAAKLMPKRTRNYLYIVIATAALVLLGGGAAAAVVVTSPAFGSEGSQTFAPSLSPTVLITFTPTDAPTKEPIGPSSSPTNFPTRSPTPPTTTDMPTARPTRSPQAGCLTFDEVCGCNLEVSRKQDILWIIDESRSVGYANYNLMQEAIRSFALNFTFGLNATRMGVIEFDAVVNDADTINFNDYLTAEEFSQNALKQFDCKPEGTGSNICKCGTDTIQALVSANEFLSQPENALRPDSNLVIIAISDGFPCCRADSSCCAGQCESFQLGFNPANKNEDQELVIEQLQILAQNHNFTMIYIPIDTQSGQTGNEASFGYTDKPPYNGLSPEEFIITDFVAFDELFEFFSNSTFQLPLPPCVTLPPTAQ